MDFEPMGATTMHARVPWIDSCRCCVFTTIVEIAGAVCSTRTYVCLLLPSNDRSSLPRTPMPFHFFFANIGYAILCWIYALAGSNRSALYFSPPEEETPQTLPARRYRSTSCVLKCSFPSTTSDPCFGRCYCVSGRRPQLASLTPRCNDFTEQVVFDTDLQ